MVLGLACWWEPTRLRRGRAGCGRFKAFAAAHTCDFASCHTLAALTCPTFAQAHAGLLLRVRSQPSPPLPISIEQQQQSSSSTPTGERDFFQARHPPSLLYLHAYHQSRPGDEQTHRMTQDWICWTISQTKRGEQSRPMPTRTLAQHSHAQTSSPSPASAPRSRPPPCHLLLVSSFKYRHKGLHSLSDLADPEN